MMDGQIVSGRMLQGEKMNNEDNMKIKVRFECLVNLRAVCSCFLL